MSISIFDNKLKKPKENNFELGLLKTKQLWFGLKEHVKENYKNILEE